MLYEIKLTRTPKNGESEDTKEHFVLDAELHGEAEQRGFELYPDHNVDVTAVYRSPIKEVVNRLESDDDRWYKATVSDVTTDESGKEKVLSYQMLVAAPTLTTANDRMNEFLRQGYDMRLDALKRTRITDCLV